jgi:hypothetical protein
MGHLPAHYCASEIAQRSFGSQRLEPKQGYASLDEAVSSAGDESREVGEKETDISVRDPQAISPVGLQERIALLILQQYRRGDRAPGNQLNSHMRFSKSQPLRVYILVSTGLCKDGYGLGNRAYFLTWEVKL